MSNLALIEPQRVDFDTQQTCDWLDGLPMIGTPGFGGAAAGAANVGTGGLVASVAAGSALGVHLATLTEISGGFAHVSVIDPNDVLTGHGVVGLPLYAGGLTLSLNPGATPFAVGDSFAIAVVPVAVDLTGLRFVLDARVSVGAVSYAIQASTDDATPTIVNGGASGVIAMRVPRDPTMKKLPVKPDGYPYSILVTDPVTGFTVPAFYGLIHHVAVAALIGQEA